MKVSNEPSRFINNLPKNGRDQTSACSPSAAQGDLNPVTFEEETVLSGRASGRLQSGCRGYLDIQFIGNQFDRAAQLAHERLHCGGRDFGCARKQADLTKRQGVP